MTEPQKPDQSPQQDKDPNKREPWMEFGKDKSDPFSRLMAIAQANFQEYVIIAKVKNKPFDTPLLRVSWSEPFWGRGVLEHAIGMIVDSQIPEDNTEAENGQSKD